MHYSPSGEQEETLRQKSLKSLLSQSLTLASNLWTTVKPRALTFTHIIWNCLQTGTRKGIKALLLSISFLQKGLLPLFVSLASATWGKVIAQDADNWQPWYRRRANKIKLAATSGFLLLALFIYLFASAEAGQTIKQLAASTPAIIAQAEPSSKIITGGGAIKIPARNTSSTHARKPEDVSIDATTPTAADITLPTNGATPIAKQNQNQNQTLFVTFISLGGDFSSVRVTVHTLPSTALTIEVSYCSDSVWDRSDSLSGTVYADSNGYYTWAWMPSPSCMGPASAYVRAEYNGQIVRVRGDFLLQ